MTRHALRTLLAVLCVALLAGCGDAEDPPDAGAASTLAQTFDATAKIENAKLDASFRFEPDGRAALGGPLVVRASGPFAAPAAGELPRLDLSIAATLGGMPVHAGVISTGKRGYLRLGGRSYRVGDELVDELRKAFTGGTAGFASLGLDPAAWVSSPQARGTARIGGVATQRIAGDIDVERLLADVARMLEGMGHDGLLTPRLRKQIADSMKSARVEIWTGVEDRILRQLTVALDFAFDEKDEAHSPWLEGGRVNRRVRLDGVNATRVDVAAPKGARPLSELAGAGGLGALLGGHGASAPGGVPSGAAAEKFLKCLQSSGESAAAIARCANAVKTP